MITVLNWFTPEIVQAFAWTLLHFIWQGTAIAAVLYMALAFTRSAQVRYNLAISALLLMAMSPVATFVYLLRAVPAESSDIVTSISAIKGIEVSSASMPVPASVDWLTWSVWIWLAGVFVFGLRALGGWVLLERLRREKAVPLLLHLQERCVAIQQRLGIAKSIRYLESRLVDCPAVIGCFRPVVLLPITALSGLGSEQLEAVIVHELAHIKRLDCLVNLFQIAIETFLFYQPAVWWVSRVIRTERENCCDDIAVRVCGNASSYARALTLMETWRANPLLAMAANNGSLKSRVSRLLELDTMNHSAPRAGLAALAIFIAASALLASTNFNPGFGHATDVSATAETPQPPNPPAPPNSPPPGPPAPPLPSQGEEHIADVPPAPPEPPDQKPAPPPPAEPPPAPSEPPHNESFVNDVRSAGYTNVSVDELIAFKNPRNYGRVHTRGAGSRFASLRPRINRNEDSRRHTRLRA